MTALDLDRYFERIGERGNRAVTTDTLERVCFGHATHIPFENLDIHRGLPISLETAAVFEKLVAQKRGGYCFEQNRLLLDVLRALGFSARPAAARVLGGGVIRPRTHMAVLVESGGRAFIADVGFGGHAILGPIIFEPDRTAEVRGETFRIREIPWDGKAHAPPPAFDLEMRESDAWTPYYRLSIEHQEDADFVAANWYTSTSPQSAFVRRKLVSRIEVGTLRILLDRELTVKRKGADVEKRTIPDDAAYRAVLLDTFGIDLPAEPPLRW